MAMKTASPWWFSAIFATGLVFLFLGERPFDHIDSARLLFSGLGLLMILGVTGLRVWTFSVTSGQRRAVERILLFCHVGVFVALLMYLTTTAWGQGLLGVDDLEGKSLSRFLTPMTILWVIVMTASLVPLLMVELSLGAARRSDFVPAQMKKHDIDEEAVEAFRVREMASSGLTMALAGAFLLVTCNVADQRNIRRDVSYFKTSSPGSATVNVAKTISEPIQVLLFFPKVNSVKNEVRGYFETLADATNNIEIAEHDRVVSAALAAKYKVRKEGTAVLAYGEKSELLTFTVDPTKSRDYRVRTELRELDGKVHTALLKIVRVRRTAYITVGHGEINDPDSIWSRMGMKSGELKKRVRDMNYQLKDLGVSQGLANEVPDDASLVMMLGPQKPLLDEEMAALDRYLARGGRLLIALDPGSQVTLGQLEGRLGLRFDPTPITDDKSFMAQTRTLRDRRLVVTNRFSSHASITTLSRAAARYGVVFINTGHLEEVPFADGGSKKVKRTHVVRSMPSAFADVTKNLSFDKDKEKRKQYNLVTAVEDPSAKSDKPSGDEDGKDSKAGDEGMRVMVFSDVDIFQDLILEKLGGAQAMLDDSVKWLGGEEHFAGEIVSEKDVVIEHTRNEDVLWFYVTIVGAPLLVLGFGLWFGWWRRNRLQRRSS